MFVIARFIENISLNGYEFILNEESEVKKFPSVEDAINFLNEATGLTYAHQSEYENDGIYFIHENDLTNE
jgi:hypothetical protein